MTRTNLIFKLLLVSIVLGFMGMNLTQQEKKEIVCFGDSITHGAQVGGHSWVYLLQNGHKDIDFINAGRNGRKTSDKEELLPVLNKYPNPDFILIFLGVNDLKNGNDSMVNQCVNNMDWMIKRIKETDPSTRIIILSPTDINLKTMSPLNVGKKYNENTKKSLVELEKKYEQLAVKDSTGFISLLHTISPSNYADGLHPNIKGQSEIAAKIWKSLTRNYFH
jgi:lysophospholipase L1-like esterase